jgi:hypothetical protein
MMVRHASTTGDGFYAECETLCRVSFIGYSARTLFTECLTWQTMTLGKERALGKDMHSTKKVSAKIYARQRHPPLMVVT